MRSFRERGNSRRQTFLSLSGSIESQLRDQYAKKHAAGLVSQASIAEKLGVNRSVINRRLTGQANLTEESIADLVWALGCCIKVDIFDPAERPEVNHPLAPEVQLIPAAIIEQAANDVLPHRKPTTASRTAKTTMSKLQLAE